MTTNTQESSGMRQQGISILGVAGFIWGVVLAIGTALVVSNGYWSAEVGGYATGSILLPLLIAYAIAGRKAKRDWNKFGLWFAALTFLNFVLELSHK